MPGRRTASYELCPLFAYSIGYWEVYRRFQFFFVVDGGLGGGSYVVGSLHGGIFHGGREIFYVGGVRFPSTI